MFRRIQGWVVLQIGPFVFATSNAKRLANYLSALTLAHLLYVLSVAHRVEYSVLERSSGTNQCISSLFHFWSFFQTFCLMTKWRCELNKLFKTGWFSPVALFQVCQMCIQMQHNDVSSNCIEHFLALIISCIDYCFKCTSFKAARRDIFITMSFTRIQISK